MALTTPTLFYTPAFDATQGYTFTFNVVGGSQVVANKLVIRNNDTNDIVYSEKIETFKYEHKLPAERLTNNTYYNAVITTFDIDKNESKPSTPIQFWCYETPVIRFTNIPAGNVIPSSSFKFEFKYTQSEGEKLNSYILKLYDANKDIVSISKEQYVVNGTPPYSGDYLFMGLQDNTIYYIEITGETANKTAITTGLIQLAVKYLRPSAFSILELENNCLEGYITIKSNATVIDGESNPSPPKYIDDREVDLTAPDSWVGYNQGYNLSGNFLIRLWFRKPTLNAKLAEFSNTNGQIITISYREGYEEEGVEPIKSYIDVSVESVKGRPYYIYSEYIDKLPDTSYYNAWLVKKNNLYQVRLINA